MKHRVILCIVAALYYRWPYVSREKFSTARSKNNLCCCKS